jgi:hypothetical protein
MTKVMYRTTGGDLRPVFPGAYPAEPGLLYCSQSEIKPELLNDGVLNLTKFSHTVRAEHKLRVKVGVRRPLRIAICGNKDAGKDKLAQCIKSMMPAYSVEIASISENVLIPLLLDTLYGKNWNVFMRERAFRDRELYRQFLFDAGLSLTEIDPSFLIRYAVRERDELRGICATLNAIRNPSVVLVTGIRGEKELEAAVAEGLIDFSVYVSRKGTEDATNQIKSNKTDVVFNNSGSVSDMRERVSRLVRSWLRPAVG